MRYVVRNFVLSLAFCKCKFEKMADVKHPDIKNLDEVFEFVAHEREDVRKMAVQGLAQHSKDNVQLERYVIKNEKAIPSLVNLLRVEEAHLLGDLLTVLINFCTSSDVAAVVVVQGTVFKALRLLDMLDRTEKESITKLKPVFEEMILMLLNNLTATDTKAVHDALQDEDEDLRGFYLSKLYRLYNASEAGSKVQKWTLNILLNCTRIEAGQEIVLEDDDWKDIFPELLTITADPYARSVALQVARNCSVGKAQRHFIALKFPDQILNLLVQNAPLAVQEQLAAVEAIAMSLATEAGMQVAEELNTKKMLQECMEKLAPMTQEAIKKDILPFLDDIQDIYTFGEGAEEQPGVVVGQN